MKLDEAVEKVAKELNIDAEVVGVAYKSFYEFIREKISELPLKDNLSEEDFNALKTNFNIPSIGKLHCTYERYLGMKEQKKYINKLKEEYEHKEN